MRTKSKTRAGTSLAYVERVNLAIDHVIANLDKPLRLTAVAKAAYMSPFHFHRVFQAMVEEPLADFVKRARLDRALVIMAHHPRQPLADVAIKCGFASASDFSRSFKQKFGASPSAFDIRAWRDANRTRLEASIPEWTQSLHLATSNTGTRNPDDFKVRIRELPARTVAYIRVHDPYKGDAVIKAVNRLMEWTEQNDCSDNQWLGYQWENPEVTPLEQCRYHTAVECDKVIPRGEVGRYRFPAMTVAEIEIKGTIDLELRALYWLYGTWLPQSGYVPADQPGFEAWIGKPFAHGMERFEINVQLPIKREAK